MSVHVLFDLETNDLIQNRVRPLDKQPELFEAFFLAIDGDTLEKIDDLHVFAKPKKPMAPGASKATGKKDSDFRDYPPFSEHAEKVKAYLEKADRVVAFNISFDFKVIDFEMQRLGMKVEWPELFDVMEQSEHLFGFRPNLTLLHETLFGHKFADAHEGRADVIAMWNCYKELINRGEI